MISKTILRIIISAISVTYLLASGQDTTAYQPLNSSKFLLSESNLIIAPLDDWGLNASLNPYGLPEYGGSIKYLGFNMDDPLYGSVPVAWLNPRQQSITLDASGTQISLSPVFADSGINYSRFDYYRGDYGFLNFSAEIAGNISENIYWRLYGEKLGYDGAYGLLGPKLNNFKESIIQNFFLDIKKLVKPWTINAGSSYQKYFPGMMHISELGTSDGETFLSWTNAGRLKEYRSNFYLTGEKLKPNSSLAIGIQASNYLYNTIHDSSIYEYNAEAFQYSGLIRWTFNAGSGKITLKAQPLTESVFVRHGMSKNRLQYQQSFEYASGESRFRYRVSLGSVNTQPVGGFHALYTANRRLTLNLESTFDFIRYPLSYYTNIGGNNSTYPDDDGFTAFQQSLGLHYRFGNSYFKSAVHYTRADYLMPFKNTIEATGFSFLAEELSRLYFTEEFKLMLPRHFSLKGKSIISPSPDQNSSLVFQGWSRFTKDLFLFENNLHLYLSGDLYYLKGSNTIGWFEQMRTQVATNSEYYTNERLQLGFIIGARISSFHIFYSIYNAEGRAFSPLPGVLYRNRLKIFGVDWAFRN